MNDVEIQQAVPAHKDASRCTPAAISRAHDNFREVEVYPGQSAEWWFVPVAAGRVTDLRCGITAGDGKTHADHGMTGEIVIE
ncbi:MAG: hypothetical protein V4661_13050 [Pseudomonadota bacterium]